MTAAAPAPPPLDAGLEQLLRRMRLPHMRRIAPEVLATAKAQRWDPAEVLRAPLAGEVAGRDRARRWPPAAPGPPSPPGRPSMPGTRTCRQSPTPPSRRCASWIRRHRADNSVTKAIGRILRADLVVVDDIGLLPVGPDAAEGLYRLVDAAYEKRNVAVSSNLHPLAGGPARGPCSSAP